MVLGVEGGCAGIIEGGGVVDEDGDADRAADAGAVAGSVGEGVHAVEVGVGGVEDVSFGVDRDLLDTTTIRIRVEGSIGGTCCGV